MTRPLWILLLATLFQLHATSGQQVPLQFESCQAGQEADPAQLLSFTNFYGQLQPSVDGGSATSLKVVALGSTESQSTGFSNETGFLATIIQSSNFLSYDVFSNSSALCDSIRSPAGEACPYGPGELAVGFVTPWDSSYPLSTINVRFRVLDTSNPSLQLACYDLKASPLYPDFWAYKLFFWFPVAIAIVYLVVIWSGRILAAHHVAAMNREAQLASSLTAKLSANSFRERLGPVFWEAASGATLQASASLRRFATPSLRELIWAIQGIAVLGLIAVNWPALIYPITATASWSLLVANVSIVQPETDLVNPLASVPLEQLPLDFTAQFADSASPIYLDQTVSNDLINFQNASDGIQRFAAAVGVEPKDLFGLSASLFLCLLAGALAISALFLLVDWLLYTFLRDNGSEHAHSVNSGKVPEAAGTRWWQVNSDHLTSFGRRLNLTNHLALFGGNCLRLLLIFHLPLVIFSTFQIANATLTASETSVALACLVLVFFCVLAPLVSLISVYRTSQPQLQEGTPTLLMFGTLYTFFGDRSYNFLAVRLLYSLAVGTVIGAGQNSGTAQAIVILVAEIADTLITSLWLPWGTGAAMGPLAFVFSVARIVTAVLLVVLSPAVSVGEPVTGWLTYVVLGIQAAVILLFLFILLVKILELLGRIIGNVPFEESKRTSSTGLGGVIRKWDRNGQLSHGQRQRRSRSGMDTVASRHSLYSAGDSVHTQSHMLPSTDRPARHQRQYSSSTNADLYPQTPGDDMDDGYIMAAMSSGPWINQESGYVPPGSYAAPQSYNPHQMNYNQAYSEEVLHDDTQGNVPSQGFKVVRGGRATDASPYTIEGARGLQHAGRQQSYNTDDQSSIDHFQKDAAGYSRPDLLSNSTYGQHSTSQTEAPPKRGFFGLLRKGRGSGNDSSDDDDEDEDEPRRGRRWPFARRRRGDDDIEAESELDDQGDLGESTPAGPSSFQVIRKPRRPE